jgi:outer membrane autotransporter protein
MGSRAAWIITSPPTTLFGFALASGGTNWGLSNALGTGRGDALQAGVYGISWFGPAYVAGALSFSNHWFTTSRSALGEQMNASFDGQSYGAHLESGYRYAVLPILGVTPFGAVQFQDFFTPLILRGACGLGARLRQQARAQSGVPIIPERELHDIRRAVSTRLGVELGRRGIVPHAALDATRQVRRRVRQQFADLRGIRHAEIFVASQPVPRQSRCRLLAHFHILRRRNKMSEIQG